MEGTSHDLANPVLTDLRLSSRDTDKLTKALRILSTQAVMRPVPRFFGREGNWCVRVLHVYTSIGFTYPRLWSKEH